ncbi:MAG: hypothetical protein ABI960_00185 [Candidatus Eisenbacteria bacterium]
MKRMTSLLLVLFAVNAVGITTAVPARAAGERADVVSASDLQASIDQSADREAAERQSVRKLLARSDVKKIAGTAGINLARANAAVGTISGANLADLAARADAINDTPGGRETVTIAVTTIIIILLLIIILAN